MKKVLLFVMFVCCSSVVLAAGESAVRDPRDVPSMLGSYNGRTKAILATSGGAISVSASDERYSNKVSTYVAGKTTSTITVSFSFNVTRASFFSDGSMAQISIPSGESVIWLPSGIGNEVIFDVPKATTNFKATLTTGATVYYVITGVR